MKITGAIRGNLILAGLVALLALTVLLVPHIQQGWYKGSAGTEEFQRDDGKCHQASKDVERSEKEAKELHDSCMRDAGWKAL